MTKSEKNVVLIVPAYNEGSVIASTIRAIPPAFTDIICVDDGSTDDTRAEILRTRAKLVSHSVNLGQGAALQTAIDYALLTDHYEYFVTYDSDGQHHIEDVVEMLKIIRTGNIDIVLGSRFLGNAENITFIKKLILKLAVFFTNTSTGIKLTDAHNGLRVFNRSTAENLKLQSPDFTHATEIIERIAQKKLRYVEVPVTITYTDYSRSKGQSIINAVNILFDIILNKVTKR